MEKVRRAIFFWTLVLSFLVITPLIIFRAQGYRFDFSRGVFVYSGTITIKSNPQDINVELNGKISNSKQLNRINNSYNLGGLIPGDYEIKISAPEFRPWTKKIDVHSGISSEFWNVVLVRENYERTIYPDTTGINDFYVSPGNRFIAYTKYQDNSLVVSIFNIDEKITEQTFSFPGWKLLDKSHQENIEWSPDENFLSVPVEKTRDGETGEQSYFIIDLEEKNSLNLGEYLGKKNIKNFRWDPREKEYLFLMEENVLQRANIKNKDYLSIIAKEVTSFDLSQENIYYLIRPNNLVYKNSLDGQGQQSQLTYNFPDNSELIVEKMIIYDDKRIALITENNNFYIFNDGDHDFYFRKIGENVLGAHFSDDGKKVVFWTANEISVYFVRDWEVQPVRLENELTNITRYGEKIDNVSWHKDYEHIIFSVGKYAKIIELDSRDHRNCLDLVTMNSLESFIRYDKSFEVLYFLDKDDDGNSSLQSIIFPEPIPILGVL